MVGGTGVSPVQAQAKACGYRKYKFDSISVLNRPGSNLSLIHISEPTRPY